MVQYTKLCNIYKLRHMDTKQFVAVKKIKIEDEDEGVP